jgi:hypothetical protein
MSIDDEVGFTIATKLRLGTFFGCLLLLIFVNDFKVEPRGYAGKTAEPAFCTSKS